MTLQWFDSEGAIDSLPVDDRGLQYGDGLFDTIAIRHGRPRLPELHFERLQSGCERLGIDPPGRTVLQRMLDAASGDMSPRFSGVAKFIVTRGSGERGYRYSRNSRPRVLLGIFDPPVYARENWTLGVAVRICTLRAGSQPALAGIKSLNRLEQVLARNEWQDETFAEGVMLDADGNVVCGTMSNVFTASETGVHTPGITNAGVCGVMRRHVIAVCEAARIPVTVEPVSVGLFRNANEIFLSNSQIGIWPVRRCGTTDHVAPGPMTRRIMSLLADSGIEECRI